MDTSEEDVPKGGDVAKSGAFEFTVTSVDLDVREIRPHDWKTYRHDYGMFDAKGRTFAPFWSMNQESFDADQQPGTTRTGFLALMCQRT